MVQVQVGSFGSLDPVIELFDTQGVSLQRVVGASLARTIANAGTYYVLFGDNQGDETGTYQITLQVNAPLVQLPDSAQHRSKEPVALDPQGEATPTPSPAPTATNSSRPSPSPTPTP